MRTLTPQGEHLMRPKSSNATWVSLSEVCLKFWEYIRSARLPKQASARSKSMENLQKK